MSRLALLGIINSLESSIQSLKWQPKGTEWNNYYEDTNYSEEALKQKKELVSKFIDKTNTKTVWDIGANTGKFSRITSSKGIQTISFSFIS